MAYKLGSLFDGSGGFPLSGTLCGVTPVWAAEVEPYPIAVTRSRFPKMRHLGDISKVNGGKIEPVDIITFGSPCQDLSVAGKRAGLKHEVNGDEETTRSGLFMEAVRIIKEMREATNGKYPRFALWENVPGAFSSNKGEDFRIVCEELIKIVEPAASMPSVPKNGWAYADSYIGDGWSLAYRVFDAQYWGVPQRRRRIHLVVDFGGLCAREVLFEREGVRGYFAESRTPWQATAGDAQDRTGADDREGEGAGNGVGGRLDELIPYTLKIRSGVAVDSAGKPAGKGPLIQENLSATLGTSQDQYLFQPVAYSFDSLASNSMKSKNPNSGCREVDVAKTLDTTDPNPSKNQGGIAVVQPVAFAQNQRDEVRILGEKAGVLQAQPGMKQQTFIVDSVGGQAERGWEGEIAPTLKATHYKCPPLITVPVAGFCTEHSAQARGIGWQEEIAPTLRAGVTPACVYSVENHPADSRVDIDESGKVQTLTSRMGTGGGNVPMIMEGKPVICLQGNGIDRADTAGCNGKGWREDTSYTLNTIDRPAVVYGIGRDAFNQGQNAKFGISIGEGLQPCMTARGPGAVSYATDVGWLNSLEEQSPTLLARGYKDPHLVTYPESEIRYIVRRLTPTECARLQGFADQWGHIEEKKDLTEEEFQFWMVVRNTHAAINGKVVKDYTKSQMLTWYNKLWTDSAEYKMWGNGIALPPALYCMQGIVEVMNREEDDSWLL